MAAECGLAATIASPLLECGKLVFGPIYRNTKGFFKLQSNLSSLQRKRTVLKEMEDKVKQQLEAADKDGKSATPQVKEWLLEVREILAVADQMQPGMIADNKGLVSGCFLSCGVSRKVRMTLEEVQRLMEACPPDSERVVSTKRLSTIEHIPTSSIEDLTTAAQNLNRVMDLFCQDEVRSVGIWGMGGVGKTTLAKNLNNKLKSDLSSGQHFGLVIWVTVSKDFNTKTVQAQIANRLGLAVGLSDDEDRNAAKLHERLMKENKFLLILDDLWKAIDLDKLGIPKPQVHNGVKILITSRSKRLCENMTDQQLQVSVLNEDEAWELFVKAAGNVANSKGIKPIARQVCQQCCGLPLAVVIVGAAMKGKDIPLWNDALSELQRSIPSIENMEDEVFKPLKWSYDILQGNTIKSCFLYCCLYPEDFSIGISELVKCWMGEGLIDEERNYEESWNRGLALIHNLKEACLLEDGKPLDEGGDTVKMHDVVRDVAIWISSNHLEDGCKFLVRAGMGLTQLSQVKGDVKRISFMNNKIHRLHCDDGCLVGASNASTLFLQGNGPLIEIPNRFLRQFKVIKVLNLSHTNIFSLPPSIMQLTDLRTLLVRSCKELEELPTLGWEGLGRLQILDLAYTVITKLPSDMARLIKLRELNLFSTGNLKNIPSGLFSRLSSLEIVNMGECLYLWRSKKEVKDGEAYLEELESINTLRELCIQVMPKSRLTWMINPSWIGKLRKLSLCIGGLPKRWRDCEQISERWVLTMSGFDHTEEEERTEYLLHDTKATSLRIYECGGMEKWVQNMRLNTRSCFSALTFLTISDVTIRLRDTLEGEYGAKYDLLPNLEYLLLFNVVGMRSISELAGHLGLTFSKLQHLRVEYCPMKYLLSVGPHLILGNLTHIFIAFCRELEKVFEYVSHPHSHSVGIVPNLKTIGLQYLFQLRTLCESNETETWPSLETIFVIECEELRKLPISGQNNSIKAIEGEESWWSNLEWDDPNTKTSLQPFFKPSY